MISSVGKRNNFSRRILYLKVKYKILDFRFCVQILCSDFLFRFGKMISDFVFRFCVQILCSDFVFRFCVQILDYRFGKMISDFVLVFCVGFLCWIFVLDFCVEFLCWIFVLDFCVGFLCWRKIWIMCWYPQLLYYSPIFFTKREILQNIYLP